MPNSLELMKERFDMLPDDTKKAISMFDYNTALKEIHTKYKLHIDQAASLEKAVADLVFGQIRSSQLIPTISSELRIDITKATEIGYDVNTNILKPIQALMQKIQEE